MRHVITTESNGEWASLGMLWRAENGAPAGARERLASRVRRETLRLRLAAISELLFLVFCAWLTREVLASWPRAAGLAWAGGVWVVALLASGFSIWNRWGLHRPVSEAATAYLAISEERARARLRAARFVQALVALELFVVVPFLLAVRLAHAQGKDASTRALVVYVLSALLGLVLVAWSVRNARRARRELAELAALRAALSE